MMTEEEKIAARAQGRKEQIAVQNYLECLAAKSKRGPRRNQQDILAQLAKESATAESSDNVVERLHAKQRIRDLENELEEQRTADSEDELEAEFVKIAKSFSDRKGIEYATWREFGVTPATLKAAGVRR